MSVNQKMTTIADAIRCYTKGTEKMGLDAMASGVEDVYVSGLINGRSQGYDNGYDEGRASGYQDGVIEGKASVLFEVHKITVSSDSPSAATPNYWLRNSEFVKQHCNDEGFAIQLISLQTFTDGHAVSYGYNGNRQVIDNGGNLITGFQLYHTSSGGINIKSESGGCINLSNKYTGIPYAKEDGSVLSIHSSGSSQLRAGDYLLILSVAEV